MSKGSPHELPFWHFFQRIEKELSYERWIDKYKLFVQGITELCALSGANGTIPWGTEAEFRRFCKFLYLQDHRHEARFDELLTEAIEIEQQKWKSYYEKIDFEEQMKANQTQPSQDVQAPQKPSNENSASPNAPTPPDNEAKEEANKTTNPTQTDTVYFKYGNVFSIDQPSTSESATNIPRFLTTDEYFPLTRREMIKSWQYLRFKEKSGFMDNMDIVATVKQIAAEGVFTAPVFKSGYANREDAIVILADTRGSMTPFEGLTDRLVETAKSEEGGHKNAPVFYFQNYPTGYLFAQRNLSKPYKLAEALRFSNPAVTYAVIIGDAGAARGNTDPDQIKTRAHFTGIFLKEVQKYTSKIIWLNPMPSHRWKGTAAEQIVNLRNSEIYAAPNVMLSVLDDNQFHFQTALHMLRLAGRSS